MRVVWDEKTAGWRRGAALSGLAAAAIATCLGFLLPAAAPGAPPSLSLTAGDATIGQSVEATAQLSEAAAATGEISFEVFGPGDSTCTGPALTPAPASASVTGDGQYVSGQFTAPAAGAYYWSAHYSGDLENPPADSICAAISTIGKASPVLAGDASDATVGGAIHDEATLSGGFSPQGEVTFSVYGPGDTGCSTALATGTAPLQGGLATSADFLTPGAGAFRWTASYPGDANNEAASTPCGGATQTSLVGKALPSLAGVATSTVSVGLTITDNATLAGGFAPTGQLVFRAYGPDDSTCSGTPHTEAVTVNGNDSYAPAGFAPGPGLYRWTIEYEGDANNEAVSTACGAANQASAVGTVQATLAASASGGTVGTPVSAAATIGEGAIPVGQIAFKAFPPGDASCSGSPAFSAVAEVAGNGSYRSPNFTPSRVGIYRWTVDYSGDANHAPATAGCGQATSNVTKAKPTIAGKVRQRVTVGTSFRDAATLQGGYAPGGTVTFKIYGPVAAGCAKPIFVNTVAVSGNGTFNSDPFVALRPGRYSFVASYSGDVANQASAEPCDSAGQAVQVLKRAPRVKPRARLIGANRISIRAQLAGGALPSGAINFRLYGPDNKRCQGKPAFSGATTVKANGSYSLAEYFATKEGVYRLAVGYSGDQRNRRYTSGCGNAQTIRVS